MYKNIIEELYYGNITPVDKTVARNSTYIRLLKIITVNEEKLNNSLDGEEKIMFTEIIDSFGEVNAISEKEGFSEGFRLGVKLMIEIFSVSENETVKKPL